MLVLTSRMNIDSKRVIDDLAHRKGAATDESYAPCIGMQYIIAQYMNQKYKDQFEILCDIVGKQADFDSDTIRPVVPIGDEYDADTAEENAADKKYNPYVDDVFFSEYYRHLEDINTFYIEKYVGEALYSAEYHVTNSIREYNKNHLDQPTLRSLDDESDVTEFADTIMNTRTQKYELNDIDEASSMLSYTLMRLINMSAIVKIHMPSYIIAYMNTVNERSLKKSIKQSSKNVTWLDVVRTGVYKADYLGTATTKVAEANRNEHAKQMFTWVSGYSDELQGYYIDCVNLMHYVTVLNIKCTPEDMLKYNRKYLQDCNISTVTPNKQYLPEVAYSLLGMDVKDDDDEGMDPFDNISELINISMSMDSELKKYVDSLSYSSLINNKALAETIYNLYSLFVRNKSVDTSLISWQGGFMYYDGLVATMPSMYIKQSVNTRDTDCVLSEFGLAIILTNVSSLTVFPLTDAVENVRRSTMENDFSDQDNKWQRLKI